MPLVIVHTNMLLPTLNPVTPDDGFAGDVTRPLPETVVQAPVPTSGELPDSVAPVEQTV